MAGISIDEWILEVNRILPPPPWGEYTITYPTPPPAPAPKVIPDQCQYHRARYIPGAPTPPAATKYPDLMEKARAEIRAYVCRSYRSWPTCPCTNRHVDLIYRDGYDPKLGDVVEGMFLCLGCSTR